jgi:hypothetical protein
MKKDVDAKKKLYDDSKAVFDKEDEAKGKRDAAKEAADKAKKWADDTSDNETAKTNACNADADSQDCKDKTETWKKQKQQKLVYEEDMAKAARDEAKSEFDRYSGEVTSFKEKKEKADGELADLEDMKKNAKSNEEWSKYDKAYKEKKAESDGYKTKLDDAEYYKTQYELDNERLEKDYTDKKSARETGESDNGKWNLDGTKKED